MACKKRKYKTYQQANLVRIDLYWNKKAYPGTLDVYKCTKCKKYYVGHKLGTLKIKPRTMRKLNSY